MKRSIRLRPWQKAALEQFVAAGANDFLAVATPGAGKTTFALTAALGAMSEPEGPRRLIVVAPTAHLKRQWSSAAAGLGLHLDPAWSSAQGALPPDMHGVVTTYQQVASSARLLRSLATKAMVIFDEIHHAGDDKAWGDSIRHAFSPAMRRLALSGTPFRSDTSAIPFVRYRGDEAEPDYEYGYGEALRDGRVVRAVHFPRTNGEMEWTAPDGSIYSATFDDALDTVRANQRLRTALSLEGDWLPAVLNAAHQRLEDIRRSDPGAGGLVIATDQDHARSIADAMQWRLGVKAVVATSDDTGASERISEFAHSARPWLVAVRMVSEGVDIPRLRVGVYATTTTTELFFRQAVGRLVRWTPGPGPQRSYLYIPDDARLRARAAQIAEVRRHSLRRDHGPSALDDQVPSTRLGAEDGDERDDEEPGQLSLFAVISAVATATEDHAREHPTQGFDDRAGEVDSPDARDDSLVVSLLPPPVARSDHGTSTSADSGGPPTSPVGNGPDTMTRSDRKRSLRRDNAELASALARMTGWGHAQVNAELNRLAGINKVTEATLDQLQRRLEHAQRWRARL